MARKPHGIEQGNDTALEMHESVALELLEKSADHLASGTELNCEVVVSRGERSVPLSGDQALSQALV